MPPTPSLAQKEEPSRGLLKLHYAPGYLVKSISFQSTDRYIFLMVMTDNPFLSYPVISSFRVGMIKKMVMTFISRKLRDYTLKGGYFVRFLTLYLIFRSTYGESDLDRAHGAGRWLILPLQYFPKRNQPFPQPILLWGGVETDFHVVSVCFPNKSDEKTHGMCESIFVGCVKSFYWGNGMVGKGGADRATAQF